MLSLGMNTVAGRDDKLGWLGRIWEEKHGERMN